ncbi:hypothetical protein MKX08_008041 [Trichoderma sp. CBMAI-0020]|nr:hypothetical protein MKX08_008041 [Trichoderma sp. CBMAI-0020]WOD46713.1 hypothetical protein [Trichoderma atroviride]
MGLVNWLVLVVSVLAKAKTDFVEVVVRLWYRRPLFGEGEDKRRIRELEERLDKEIAEREKETDELLKRQRAPAGGPLTAYASRA